MNPPRSRECAGAFTLVELLVTIAIIGVLAALLLPALNKGLVRARQASCAGQLKQVGIAEHSFAHDHNSLFPPQVPTAGGGSLEFARAGFGLGGDFFFSFRHFQVLSNDLPTPRILACPADQRVPALSFAALKNDNLSYMAGITADYKNPNSILAGDRNLTNAGSWTPTLMGGAYSAPVGWTHELHQLRGNLLFADGHVEQTGIRALRIAFGTSSATNIVATPTLVASAGRSGTGARGTPNDGRTAGPTPARAASPSPTIDPSPTNQAAAPQAPPPAGGGQRAGGASSATLTGPGSAAEATEIEKPAPTPAPTNAPGAGPSNQGTGHAETVFPLWLVEMLRELLHQGAHLFYWLLLALLLMLVLVRYLMWRRSRERARAGTFIGNEKDGWRAPTQPD